MRLSGIVFATLTASLLATAAMAQPAGGSMSGPSMSGPSMSGPAMKGGGMQMNSMGGVGIFSRENMAMMIVDREKATKGMSADQAAAARKDEMAKHGSETAGRDPGAQGHVRLRMAEVDRRRKERRPDQAGRSDEGAWHDGCPARQQIGLFPVGDKRPLRSRISQRNPARRSRLARPPPGHYNARAIAGI